MKTYIIRQAKNELSHSLAADAAASAKIAGVETEFFEGVSREDARDFFRDNAIVVSGTESSRHWTPGTMGCFASHYSLWKKCYEEDETLTILEHDAIVVRNPNDIVRFVKHACHLDCALPFNSKLPEDSEDHFKIYNEKVKEYRPGVMDHPSNTFYNTANITGSCFRGAYGYIITPEGAARILTFCDVHGAFPADRMICENAVTLQRAACTYVRLNPFFKTLRSQRLFSTRA